MRVDRLLARLLALVAPFVVLGACSFDFGKLFERDDPQVEMARRALEASLEDGGDDVDLTTARQALEEVLKFRCEADGGKDLVIDRPYAALDLGLVMFRIAELVGPKFGDEETHDAGPAEGDELIMAARAKELDCAHLLLRKLAADPTTPPSIALRARYLLGNFAFLARKYKDAIARYDEVLVQHPARGTDPATAVGPPPDDDAVARYAAWNRAIALKRLEDQNDAGPDAQDSSSETDAGDDAPDAPDETSKDAGADASDGGSDGGAPDAGSDGGTPDTSIGDTGAGESGAGDAGESDGGGDGGDGGEDAQAPKPQPTTAPPPASSLSVDLRELDRFDKKPTLDLDFKAKAREKKKLPKALDK